MGKEVVFRADVAFAKPEIYEALEERGVKYANCFPAHDSLTQDIADLLTQAVAAPVTGLWSGTRAFRVRPQGGRRCVGGWRRWSSTLASCSLAWVSS
jgi:hypothetical protein